MMKNIYLVVILVVLSLSGYGQSTTDFIVVDQFGYLPDVPKIAVIRDPQTGFDAGESFSPGGEYALVNAETNEHVYTSGPEIWNSGQTNASSGDKTWWFDFSSFTTSGKYYVLDVEKNVRSFEFEISPAVYNEVLRQAVRTFFYQRVGYKKEAQFAGQEWADGASHIGPGQDKEARLFSSPNNAATEKDLSGGWYDAGDYNKYTNWTANYVVEMMKAYLEAPQAWGDDYHIPESGNGVPDLLDEAKWGIDHLLRMQNEDGSVLSIVDEDHASPPSSATGPSLYGPATTSATLNTASALAISSKVFSSISMTEYADRLKQHAIKAWEWADANPDVLFKNNDSGYNSVGIGAGQQEESDYQREMTKLEAASFLFDITKDEVYKNYFDANYTTAHLLEWGHAYPFEVANQEALLYYALIPEATAGVADDIKSIYENSMKNGSENFPAWSSAKDPYRAHLQDYTWGSNSIKAAQGNMFYDFILFELDQSKDQEAKDAAMAYINYIHGVNPLNMVYLSNMYDYGAENSVNEFYHTWFADGSAKWDRVGESTYGPAPGFVTGGPNPSYDWDGCCPDGCGSASTNAVCTSISIDPPKNQPAQKSYKDFNTSWPLNSWSVTENSCGYQINYIRLLSKFVDTSYDCNGVKEGTASFDVCGMCAGGNTGVEPVTDPAECGEGNVTGIEENKVFSIYPSPGENRVFIQANTNDSVLIDITDVTGRLYMNELIKTNSYIDIIDLPNGTYFIVIKNLNKEIITREKFIKKE